MAYTIADLVEHAVDLMPERVALESDGESRTYAELDARANALAHKLRELGVQPGQAVGLYSRNTIEAVESMLAIFKIRAVMVNVNYRYVEAELEHLIADSGMVVLIHERQYSRRVCNTLSKDGAQWALTDRIVIEDGSGVDIDCADGPAALAIGFEEAIESSSSERDFEARSDDDLYMLYTGGTTGKPKGVVWRQEDVWRVLGGGIDWYTSEPVDDEWQLAKVGAEGGQLVRYPIPPFIHGGSQWAIFQSLFAGGKAVVYPEFSGASAWDIVERHGVNVIFITGDAMGRPMIEALSDADGHDLSSVVSIASSAALFSPSVKDQFLERFPNAIVVDAIGSSETGFGGLGVATKGATHTGGPKVKADSQTHVLRADGTRVEPGSGEIGMIARTGHIPLRYHNDPEKSAQTFKEYNGIRYSLPGDFAQVDAEGNITMLGRGSVSINTGGEKVFPEEVEGALKAHPDVFDTVVVGVDDERWGQRVAAVIAPRDGARPSLADLNAVVRTELAGYKCPRSVWFVDEIKRSPAGKPDYRWGVEITRGRPADEALDAPEKS